MAGKLLIWRSVILSGYLIEVGSDVSDKLTFVYSNYQMASHWVTYLLLFSVSGGPVPRSLSQDIWGSWGPSLNENPRKSDAFWEARCLLGRPLKGLSPRPLFISDTIRVLTMYFFSIVPVSLAGFYPCQCIGECRTPFSYGTLLCSISPLEQIITLTAHLGGHFNPLYRGSSLPNLSKEP